MSSPEDKPSPVDGDRELAPLGTLEESLYHAADLARDSLVASTRRAYESDWRAFEAWAQAKSIQTSLPVSVLVCAAYLADLERSGLKVTTIRRRMASLASKHREIRDEQGEPLEPPTTDPAIRKILRGIARRRAAAGERRSKKRPLTPSMAHAALPELTTRDRAIAILALVTGLRRSELAALRWQDLEQTGDGWIAWVRISKTDQAGEGRPVAVPRGRGPSCPARAIRDLRRARELQGQAKPEDRVFGVGPWSIAQTIKRVAELAGEDPEEFGAHSARAGMLTTASEAGVDIAGIMRQSGHASTSVAMGYIRPAEQARNPAARAVVKALEMPAQKAEDHDDEHR